MNTCILRVLELHDALRAALDQAGNRARPAGSASRPRSSSGLVFLGTQINEYFKAGFAISDGALASVFYGLTGLHGRTSSSG